MTIAVSSWFDAETAATLFAVDPVGTGGICVRASAGPVRDRWLERLRLMLPPDTAVRKLPAGISESRLLGGIDLAGTLQAGRPLVERGLLAEVHGGVLLAVMAERLASRTVALLNATLDSGELVLERDGLSQRSPARFGLVAFDEGGNDERAADSLCDRLAFQIDLSQLSWADTTVHHFAAADIAQARRTLGRVIIAGEGIAALGHASASLGIMSLRPSILAVRVARAAAALDGENEVQRAHLELAARLVLAPRATVLPAPENSEPAQPEPDRADESENGVQDDKPLQDVVLEAAQAAVPAGLLNELRRASARVSSKMSDGRQGAATSGPRRGRPVGVRRGELTSGARLNVLETLRAAAPWQPLRRRGENRRAQRHGLLIRKDDFRITRFKQRSATSTIMVVDASGSAALQRLAEVKGAVELLLADCYVRRDEVALIAFRGRTADLILPPTRSLTRAKRSIAALPGGGGTPLSAAVFAATTLGLAVRCRGRSPTIVLMTDGRANVTRDGVGDRQAAETEAWEAARQLRATGIPAVVIDTSPRPQPQAQKIAKEMDARYVALPYADAARLSREMRGQ